MTKTILITGATDGIGLETVRTLLPLGHKLLVHGRSEEKLRQLQEQFKQYESQLTLYRADLSEWADVQQFASKVLAEQESLDVLINNAGVFKTPNTKNSIGLDTRVMVNVLAPFYITMELLPLFNKQSRVVNLSSAAQSPIDFDRFTGRADYLNAMDAYAQSKLAITAWSGALAQQLKDKGPAIIAVNPGSLLASKMVKEGFGVSGNSLQIGADILIKASLDQAFADASGQYFDNDAGKFALPHPDANDPIKVANVMTTIEKMISA